MDLANVTLQNAVQRAAGAIALDPLRSTKKASEIQGEDLQKEPLLPAADAKIAIQELLTTFGFEKTEQLAAVTQADCLSRAKDPIEGLALFALVVVVQSHVGQAGQAGGGTCASNVTQGKPCVLPPRKEPLPKLDVEALAGDYEAPAQPRRIDPLVLIFKNVAPSTPDNPVKLLMTNRSDLDDPKPIELPADLSKVSGGQYSFQADGAWMGANHIKPGAVLELSQVKLDQDGNVIRKSDPTFVCVNPGGAKLISSPALPPGDVIGDVTHQANLRLLPDPAPTAIRPDRIRTLHDDNILRVSLRDDKPAAEAFSKIRAENLATRKVQEPAEVGKDGAFESSIDAMRGEPVMLRAVDHSRALDDPFFTRLMVLRAGVDKVPMLVTNPALGLDAPPRIALGRLSLGAGKDCQQLISDAGITPGSVVTITRVPEETGKTGESVRTVAGPDGSLAVNMPFAVHEKDVFDVQVQNAFGLLEKSTDIQRRAAASARFEVGGDGSLKLVSSQGAVFGADTAESKAGVTPLDNVDRVSSGTPYLQDARFQIQGFKLAFRPRDWNTGNSASIQLSADSRAEPQVAVRAEGGQLVVTLHSELRGGWPEPSKGFHKGVGFGTFGGSSWTSQNNGVAPVRDMLVRKGEGVEVPVRFVTSEGKQIATGNVRAKWGTYTEGGGSIYINEHWGSVSMPVERYRHVSFDLVPESLVHG